MGSRNWLWWIRWTLIALILFTEASRLADAARGYDALGGEGLLLLLPFIANAVGKTVDDWKQIVREIRYER